MLDGLIDLIWNIFRGFAFIFIIGLIAQIRPKDYVDFFRFLGRLYMSLLNKCFTGFFGFGEKYQAHIAQMKEQGTYHTQTTRSDIGDKVFAGIVIAEIAKKYNLKFSTEMTDTDKSVIMAAFLSGSMNVDEFVSFVNEHPIVSSYLIDKFIDLYHERKIQNKPINFLEIQMFIETAKLFK